MQVTRVFEGEEKGAIAASRVDAANGSFVVAGEPGAFAWVVHGRRAPVTAEVSRSAARVRGDGPYTYLVR